ncbi:MAG: DUF3576 domain-containing protein [Gemmobacter sp.]
MTVHGLGRLLMLGLLIGSVASCGRIGSANPFGGRGGAIAGPVISAEEARARDNRENLDRFELAERRRRGIPDSAPRETIFDLFRRGDQQVGVSVNRYLWTASLEVLSFLPPETVDPFTGVISTGYGTPPGGGRAYRATVLISDPALDARSLKVAMQVRGGGAVSPEVLRRIEDAILTRARQLRVEGGRF